MQSSYCEEIDKLMDRAQNWCLEIEQEYNKAEVHSINMSKGDTEDVGVFSDNSEITVFEFLESAELAYLGWGNSVQKANRLYNRHLSEEIKSRLINISDNYESMKQWLIKNYGGPSRIIEDIIGSLTRKPKPEVGNRKEKFIFYSAITGAMQRLERLSRVSYIDRSELETCLLSRSTLSSMISLLPILEYDFWVREMTTAGLDFKNPVGIETFNCFKKICVIERNTCENSRTDSAPVEVQSTGVKRTNKSSNKVQVQEKDYSDTESEVGVHTTATSIPRKPWNPSTRLKFPCPIGNNKHEVSTCPEFLAFSPLDRWEKIENNGMCYTCLNPKNVCKLRKCDQVSGVPEVLTCAICATWAESQNLAPFSIFFCKQKTHSSAIEHHFRS